MHKLSPIPLELSDFCWSNDFDEDRGFLIKNIDFNGSTVVLKMKIYFGSLGEGNGDWEITISDYKRHSYDPCWEEDLKYHTTHPLLLEYNEHEASLFFSSSPDDKNKLVTDIYNSHYEICNGWIEVGRFLNHNNLVTQCNSSFGLFAKGPASLINSYKSVLDNNNMANNILEKNANGKYAEDPPHYMLLTLGDSYFIGKEFNFKKIG